MKTSQDWCCSLSKYCNYANTISHSLLPELDVSSIDNFLSWKDYLKGKHALNTDLLHWKEHVIVSIFSEKRPLRTPVPRSLVDEWRYRHMSEQLLSRKLRLQKIVTSTLNKWFLCYSTTVHMASNRLRTSKVFVKRTPLIHEQKWPPCWKFIFETHFNMSRASFLAEDHVMQIE